MRGMGIRNFIGGITIVLALGLATLANAKEEPEWEFTVQESKLAAFEAVLLHPKEDNWLLTCRMRVKSLKLVPRVSEVELVGLAEVEEGAEEEVVWEKSHTIRRKDFEAAYGGGRSQFVRVFLRDIPENVVEVQLRYGSEEGAE